MGDQPRLKLSMLKEDVKFAAEQWLLMAEVKQKHRFGRHFDIHLDAISRDASRSSKSGMTLDELEESELAMQKRYWNSQYTLFFGGGQEAPENVQKVARQKKLAAIRSYITQVFLPDCVGEANNYASALLGAGGAANEGALNEFLTVCRSLSIATEQYRDKFRSEYKAAYPRWEADQKMRTLPTPPAELMSTVPISKKKHGRRAGSAGGLSSSSAAAAGGGGAGTTGGGMTREQQLQDDLAVKELLQAKKIVGPSSDPNLLTWAGDVLGANSRYREDFRHFHHRYQNVIPPVQTVSLASNRIVPQSELSENVMKPVKTRLAFDKQTRFLLKREHPCPDPSWHLLYKDGVSYTVGRRHDPGEKSIYGLEYAAKVGTFKPAQPTIDPFESNIKIKMSDFKYHNTTYADTICESAKLKGVGTLASKTTS